MAGFTKRMAAMMVSLAVGLGFCGASAAATAPLAAEATEEAAVLATMDRWLLALAAGNYEGMKSLQSDDGMTFQARTKDGANWTTGSRGLATFLTPAGRDNKVLRERYWTPTVLLRGPIAMVWAPYEFWVDGKTSHCGIDAFSFIRKDGVWRLANAMWTAESLACAELRPHDAALIRPKD